jgi:peptidoglycan/xylan/chitin deacetylase (PgdA/CDA1 family)
MQNVGEVVDYRRILDMDTPNDRPLFLITIDDGWRDNYEYALPILRKHHAPALIFLATAAIESGDIFWPEDLVTKTHHAVQSGKGTQVRSALTDLHPASTDASDDSQLATWTESWVEALKLLGDEERKRCIADYYRRIGVELAPLRGQVMSWDEIREMHASGIDFGSHTHTHKILKGASAAEMERELTLSRNIITAQLDTPIDTFCYPNARYTGTEGPLLTRCGYRYSFRIDNLSFKHYSDAHYVPRFMVYEDIAVNPAYFKLRLLEMPLYKGPRE